MVFDPRVEAELRQRAKAQIRKRMRALRNSVPAAALAERSARIVDHVTASPPWARATEVALFATMTHKNEVDLGALDTAARARGKRVAYPALTKDRDGMVFRRATTAELADRGAGFREPPPEAPVVLSHAELLIVVPALALDGRGHRIGYGLGYYDRTLSQLCPPAMTLAVAYDFQLLAEVPVDAWDRPIDWIATDAGLRETAPSGAQ